MSAESIFVAVTVPLAGAIVTFITARYGRKGDRENQLIDQLQGDRDTDRERLDRLESELQELRITVVHLVARDTQWRIHTERLSQQVLDFGGTPYDLPRELAQPPRTGGT